jgi:hypothetical protein
MLKGGRETIMPRGFLFQEFFEGLSEDALGVSRPTVFLPAMTRLFSSILFYLMRFTGQTGFDNHGSPTSSIASKFKPQIEFKLTA